MARYSLQINKVLFTEQDSDPQCHLCIRKEEEVTTLPPEVSSVTKDNVLELQEIYRVDGLDSPLPPSTITYRNMLSYIE